MQELHSIKFAKLRAYQSTEINKLTVTGTNKPAENGPYPGVPHSIYWQTGQVSRQLHNTLTGLWESAQYISH